MNTETLFLFIILLLLGLVLCSFLGGNYSKEFFTGTFNGVFSVKPTNQINNVTGKNESSVGGASASNLTSTNYDNYNHYSGSSSQLTNGTTFYGKNGGSVKVNMQSNGTPMLTVTLSQGEKPINFVSHKDDSSSKSKSKLKENYSNFTDKSADLEFYGPNGETALVINYKGHQAIKVNTPNGVDIYTINTPSSSNETISNPFNSNYTNYNNTPSTYFGSTGVTGANINNSNKAYNNSLSQTIPSSLSSPTAPSAPSSSTPYDYSDSLPTGIPKSQIPPGKEDLYILKSEIVPPVCPACPASAACPRQEKCPPCPACARCPEPAFECKKVPNYNSVNNSSNNYNGNFLPFQNNYSSLNSSNNSFLPVPVLSDFSSFGM
jgi:hypothetical protein